MRQQGGKSQQQLEYSPGTIVFAKLKGYPWWPARIESDQNVPAKVLKQKSKAKGALYTVFFYGSRDYGFFGPDAIRPFHHETVENDLKAKKFKTKDLELAVRQALNPSLLKEAEESDEDGEEEEEEEEDEEEEEEPKGKRKAREPPKRKTNNSRGVTKKTTETQPKRRGRKAVVGDEDTEEAPQKKRRKSMSAEKEESPITQVNDTREEIKKTPEYKKVYHIRHKLQRLVYNKKEGEIPKDDYPKILEVIKEIEEAPLTYNLLRDTKIGKVVKAACVYPFEDGTIKERCQQLMKTWKATFLDAANNQSPSSSSQAAREKTEDNLDG
ncbi:Tudor/PWWP/MBT [Rhizopus microsporus var. microsporus]|uniref:Tudor/PWWP/MBT n=2 Tax=Rhizopus microsporus TaxID=58291 RepID=A0A2G4SKQ4_RHIZD|nr:Tudor/PWWP/MBT [Rhizopus microsporus ATCC 52813]ORE09497.1 Tudor/PWWP/MBT [Rhizopus microsporus var. microsporus]PHZ09343.1 Tudor/PWWP/MBT [Rhizopus microsporus ATCC 52813]